MYVPIAETPAEAREMNKRCAPALTSQRTLQLIYRLRADARVRVQLVNAQGRIAREFNLGRLAEGTHTSQLDVTKMPAGIYNLQLVRGAESTATKQTVVLY